MLNANTLNQWISHFVCVCVWLYVCMLACVWKLHKCMGVWKKSTKERDYLMGKSWWSIFVFSPSPLWWFIQLAWRHMFTCNMCWNSIQGSCHLWKTLLPLPEGLQLSTSRCRDTGHNHNLLLRAENRAYVPFLCFRPPHSFYLLFFFIFLFITTWWWW